MGADAGTTDSPPSHPGISLKMVGTASVSGNPQTGPECRKLRAQNNVMARTGGEIKVSMRRLYLSWGLVKKEVTKGRMCQRVRRLGNGMGKDVGHV